MKILNITLVVICAVGTVYTVLRPFQLHSEIIVNPDLQCGEVLLGEQAKYLAYVCSLIVERRGSLPNDKSELGQLIGDEILRRWGPSRPTDLRIIDSKGELRDCFGHPFEVSVGSNRVTVTSPSSYTFYHERFPVTSQDSP